MRYLTTPLFLLVLSSTSLATQSVVWNGLTHNPEGLASLSVTSSGNLLVDNLGSSGCDGVSIAIPPTSPPGLTTVHSIFMEPFGPPSPQPGTAFSMSYQGTLGGVQDQEFAAFELAWQQGGMLRVGVDFDNLGSSGYDLALYNNGSLVGSENGLSAADLSLASPFLDNVETCWVYCDRFNDFEITFTSDVMVFVQAQPGVLVDEMVLLPATPLIQPERFSSTTVRAMNLASFEFTNELVGQSTQGVSYCNGDGGDQMGCSDCPCGNEAPVGTIGGCLNGVNRSARITATGWPSVSLPVGDLGDLRFGATGLPAAAFGVMVSGNAVASLNPASPCFGLRSGVQSMAFDGLRCAVGNIQRHGGRPADFNGDVGVTNNPWGGEAAPTAGIAAQGGFGAGQTAYFQLIYRDSPQVVCMRGLNTSQAVEITFIP